MRVSSLSRVSRPRTAEPPAPVPPELNGAGRGPVRVRRQPRWVAAGVLAMCLGGLGAVFIHDASTTQSEVVVVNKPVARGEVIEATDVGVAQVGVLPGIQTVPADQAAGLVGQRALVDLSPGLLPAGTVGQVSLPPGRALLGLRLSSGRIPTRDLPPGTKVLIVSVPSAGQKDAATSPQVVVPAVVVSRPSVAVDQTSWLVEVHVARADAEEVAALAAQDRIVVVQGE